MLMMAQAHLRDRLHGIDHYYSNCVAACSHADRPMEIWNQNVPDQRNANGGILAIQL